MVRVVILPGNGCDDVEDANWYLWLKVHLLKDKLVDEVVLRTMPDPYVARETQWIPFIKNQIGVGPDTIIVGHSSGAEAAMRLLGGGIAGNEDGTKVLGVVLVSACHTDLGVPNETASGYYARPWNWNTIKSNAQWIVQFHSDDDPFIPVEEARHVANSLGTEYHELPNRQHFFDPFDELLVVLREKIGAAKAAN